MGRFIIRMIPLVAELWLLAYVTWCAFDFLRERPPLKEWPDGLFLPALIWGFWIYLFIAAYFQL
jgi:hypothetical protein